MARKNKHHEQISIDSQRVYINAFVVIIIIIVQRLTSRQATLTSTFPPRLHFPVNRLDIKGE